MYRFTDDERVQVARLANPRDGVCVGLIGRVVHQHGGRVQVLIPFLDRCELAWFAPDELQVDGPEIFTPDPSSIDPMMD